MKKKIFHKLQNPIVIVVLVIFISLFVSIGFFYAVKDQLQYGKPEIVVENQRIGETIGEITKGRIIEQVFSVESDAISGFSLVFATYDRKNSDTIILQLIHEGSGAVLHKEKIKAGRLNDNALRTFYIKTPIEVRENDIFRLNVQSETGSPGNAVTLYKGIRNAEMSLSINSIEQADQLFLTVEGRSKFDFFTYYWVFFGILYVLILSYTVKSFYRYKKHKSVAIITVLSYFRKYWFLLSQLVSRDFKTKYKRSVLGVFWSLLNPLLTMTVQYIVFSNLFRFGIQNFAVYLLSGIVFFNFMSEATTLSMMSILQNSSLINKVFVPKFIYPFSRVMSSTVNFFFAFVSLFLVIFITGLPIQLNYFFLLYSIIFLLFFITGLSLILSSLMVFFRDTQFIYGVLVQIWLYLTPLFYPVEILPRWVMRILQFNPMYHFINFSRIIILEGRLPNAEIWLLCAFFGLLSLVLGVAVFNRNQNKFILYI